MAASEEKICSNCEKSIPVPVYELHVVHCHRFRTKCDECGEVMRTEKLEAHSEEHRREEKCPHCEKSFPESEFRKHASKCAMFPQSCDFCGSFIATVYLPEHVAECGSRTDACPNCSNFVPLSYMADHLAVCLSEVGLSDGGEAPKPRKRLRKTHSPAPEKKPRKK